MTDGVIMEVFTDALYTGFLLAAPPLIISVVVGLIIAIMQAATQVHEQTLTFVPKLVAIGLTLVLLGPWMIETISDFTRRVFENIAMYA